MTRYSYFPGCSQHGTAREMGESTVAVFDALGLGLDAIEDWVCCGATPAHATDPVAADVLGRWNLARASKRPGVPVVTGCAACFARLRATREEIRHRPDRAGAASDPDGAVDPRLEILHVAQVLGQAEVIGRIRERARTPLNGLPVACYYGCLLTRPPGPGAADDAEEPTLLETVAQAAGAAPVPWPLRLDCCGSSLALPRPDLVAELAGKLLASAHARGAKAIVVACPLCHANLDVQQAAIARSRVLEAYLPVVYLTQLVGLALGLPGRSLGLHRHFVPVPFDAWRSAGAPAVPASA